MHKVISIVVTYNGASWVENCFGSLVQSNIEHHKVLAIDNGSTDKTLDIIKEKFPTVEIIETNENIGFGKANNIGLAKAIEENADYVFLLNQDAWLLNNSDLNKLIATMEENQTIGICSPIQYKSEKKLDLIFSSYIKRDQPSLLAQLENEKSIQGVYQMKFVNAASWLISKRCLIKSGGFAPIFEHYGEDSNYVNRISYFGFDTVINTDVRVIHDRPQTFHQDTQKSKYLHRLKMMNLNFLMDINYSLLRQILYVFGMMMVKTGRVFFTFKLSKLLVPFSSFCYALSALNNIKVNRMASKSDRAFL